MSQRTTSDDEPGHGGVLSARAGGAAAYFEQAQAGVIRSLVSQIAELVSADSTAAEVAETGAGSDALEAQLGLSNHAELPDDPVLARLLPDGYADDPEASAEFRRYTEESLRTAKVAVGADGTGLAALGRRRGAAERAGMPAVAARA